MTTQRRIMLAAGVGLLFVLHIVAAFALGVYVGRYGLTRDGLALQGPHNAQRLDGPQLAPGGQPPAGQPGNLPQNPPLPGEPTLVGRIRRIEPGRLDLATPNGPRQVSWDAATRVRELAGATLAVSDLEEENTVAIFGTFSDGGQLLQAELIVLLPPPDQAQPRPPANP